MELFRKTYQQISDVLGGLAPSQRLTLLVVPVLVLAAFAYLLNGREGTTLTPLSLGKEMTTEELINAESALQERGLTNFERRGRQLLVPSDEAEKYNAALLAGGGMPTHWAGEWADQFEKSSIFTSREQLATMQEIALANQLRRMIRAIPGIADGTVVWARSKKRVGLKREKDPVTATITIKPRPGHDVTAALGQSLKHAVANMIPDLSPERVVVFSTDGRLVTETEDDDPLSDRYLDRIRQFTEKYRSEIEAGLAYIPGVLVTVNVDLDNVRSEIIRSREYDPKKFVELRTSEETRNLTASTTRPKAEPGAVSNQARSLDMAGGPEHQQADNETSANSIRAASFTDREQRLVSAIPKAVLVSVSVPEDYYENALIHKGVEKGDTDESAAEFDKQLATFRTTVEADVTTTAARAIGATDDKITVTSFVRIPESNPFPAMPILDRIGQLVGAWGGTVALFLFALWALRAVIRAAPAAPAEDEEGEEPKLEEVLASGPTMPMDEQAAVERDPEPTARDELQSVVRDNPEMAAAVIGKWIKAGT